MGATYTELGHGIEGLRLIGTARRKEFKQGALRKHPITNIIMVTYELDRNCTLSIDKEIALEESQRTGRTKFNIHLDKGEMIIADASRLCIASRKDCLADTVKEGVTSRHGASIISTPEHAIAIIKTPLKIYGNRLISSSVDQKQIDK